MIDAEVGLVLPEGVEVRHRPCQFAARQSHALAHDGPAEWAHAVQPGPRRVQRGSQQAVVLLHHALGAFSARGLTTGATAPYPGTVSQQGKFQVTNIPLPADISTKVAHQKDFWASLIHETLNWSKVSIKVEGQDAVQHRLGRLPEGQAAVVDHLHRDDERSRPPDVDGQRFGQVLTRLNATLGGRRASRNCLQGGIQAQAIVRPALRRVAPLDHLEALGALLFAF